MKTAFYPRLAWNNIRKNNNIYLPYLLAASLMVGLYYILRSIAVMVLQSKMEGYGHMYEMLQVSATICGILSFPVLIYINSFIMKQRKREFGLYGILGLGKSHIAFVVCWEGFFAAAASIGCGILGGALLSQLLFLILMHLVRLPVSLQFQIPLIPVAATIVLFLAVFAFTLVMDVFSIWHTNPADLLRSSHQGEKEPRSRRILAVLGILTLGAGYLLSWSIKSPYDALGYFFPAVLLVIAGTFLLFISGSIVLLKALRKNKKFYYRPSNFIAVSGMLYRMKRNAAGLANICILSTCVLVTLSSTVCLFLGEEDSLKQSFPRQVLVEAFNGPEIPAFVQNTAQSHAQAHGFEIENIISFREIQSSSERQGDSFTLFQSNGYFNSSSFLIYCLALDDYQKITGSQAALEPNTALLWLAGEPLQKESFSLGNAEYRVAASIPRPDFIRNLEPVNVLVAVLPGQDDLDRLADQSLDFFFFEYDISGPEENLDSFNQTLIENFRTQSGILHYAKSVFTDRDDFYQLYGGLFFIGIFFVALFLIATVIIIYYKQITEGFEDSARFQIMERIGMSHREIRQAIHKQILLVFFLPLGTAIIHIAAAFPVLRLLLWIFRMDNVWLFLACTAGSILIFALFYFIVYRLTARTYYKIVQPGRTRI